MLAEISAGFGSLKAAFDIAKGLNATSSQVAINDAKITLQAHILDAQQALAAANDEQSAAAKRIDDLEQEIMRLKDWTTEKERYELKRYHPGSLAYALKEEMKRGETPHKLCPNCYGRNEKSFLQPTGESIRRYTVHRCFSCRAELPLGPEIVEGVPPPDEGPVIA